MEPLLHFTIPFVSLALLGVKPSKALPLAALCIIPDLDALFLVHRSLSHSIITMGLGAIPFLIGTWRLRPQLLSTVWLGLLTVASHPILDLFSGYTPVLWPLYRSIQNPYG